jgi:hypothetical protein
MDAERPPRSLRALGGKITLAALYLTLPVSTGRTDDTIVETSHAVVEARDEHDRGPRPVVPGVMAVAATEG